MSRYCLLFPTYVDSTDRQLIAQTSYRSLLKTIVPNGDAPLFVVCVWKGQIAKDQVDKVRCFINSPFQMETMHQPDGIEGSDQSICYAMEQVILKVPGLTHVILLCDDILYHPDWFVETKALVERHPDAKAWTIYRSAHTRHHRTVARDGFGDHSVTSMAGSGMCITLDEWKAWGIKASDGMSWPIPTGGHTIDLHHAWARPGERWATDKSYIQHIGKIGVHCTAETPEYALEFVGEV